MRGDDKSGEEPGARPRSKGPEVGRETREERGRCLDLGFVRVCSGPYDKIPPTGWLVNNRKFFRFWRLRVQDGAPAWSVLVRPPRCRPRPRASRSVLTGRTAGVRGEGALRLLYEAPPTFPGSHPHGPSTPQRPHLLTPALGWGRGGSPQGLKGDIGLSVS